MFFAQLPALEQQCFITCGVEVLLLGILGVPAPTSQSKDKKIDMDAYLSLAELHLC